MQHNLKKEALRGAVDMSLAVPRLISGFTSLSDEILSPGPSSERFKPESLPV